MGNNYMCPECGSKLSCSETRCEICGCQAECQIADISLHNEPGFEKMSFNYAVKKFFLGLSTMFCGRARRKEYWSMVMFNVLLFVASVPLTLLSEISVVFALINLIYTYVVVIYFMAASLPLTAVSVKRLHDINKSGWWLLLGIVPIIGGIVILVYMLRDGDKSENKYGKSPKYIYNK